MNVLFIVSDDLTNNSLSCYGSPQGKSPHIDKLAAKGVRFERAYCQFPLCNPSRASFLTGLRPDQIRVYDNAVQFRQTSPDVQSLPQTFRKAGYFVGRVGKLYHYGVPGQIGTDGLDDPPSWEQVVNPKGRDKDDEGSIFTINKTAQGAGRFGGTLSWLAADGEDSEQTDGKSAAAVVKLLEEKQSQPFFIACGFFRPHTPYVAPKKYFEMYPAASMKLPIVPAKHRDSAPELAFGSYKKEQDVLTDELRQQALQAYHAATTFMDAQVGIVLASLERLKLADKTIVVFLSDHGYHLGEHGLWQKMSLFENSARVPLIIYDPRAQGNGKVSPRTVELIDLHPTLADACGIAPPGGLLGKSLTSLLKEPTAAWNKPALTQVTRGKNGMGYSLRTERFRYTEWDRGEKGTQLYDLEKDPGELQNLAEDPAFAEVVRDLKTELHKAATVK
jgi:uncharacterized sulfatase